MLETSYEGDEGKVTKESNMFLLRDPIASLPSGILETANKRHF